MTCLKAAKKKRWFWFKNGLEISGTLNIGWYGIPSALGSIKFEKFDFVPCHVTEWRRAWKEPENLKAPPEITEGALWKTLLVETK